MPKTERVDTRLDRLEAQLMQKQAQQGKFQHRILSRVIELEAAIEKLVRDQNKSRKALRDAKLPTTMGSLLQKAGPDERISLPDLKVLRTLCTSELLELGRLRNAKTFRGLGRIGIIRALLGDLRGQVQYLKSERKVMGWLMNHSSAIAATMPCALNCTKGCPDAMVAACYYDNAKIAEDLRRKES